MQPAPTRRITVLGPQRLKPTLIRAVEARKVKGRIATVTAGWQEREDEDRELHEHLGKRTLNLRLYHRAEALLSADKELRDGLRERGDRLRELQRLYRLRLHHALQAAHEMLNAEGRPETVASQREAAVNQVRWLDTEHLERVREVHREFEARIKPDTRDSVVAQRQEIAVLLDDTEAIAIAGGHVAILLNRLRLFDLPGLIGARPLFLWSAGAMACSDRVVLFHDSPPQGAGDPEVLELGLGLVPLIVPLPHARHRLRLTLRNRVRIFARRFSPAICVALDEGARIDFDGPRWKSEPGTRRLTADGDVIEIGETVVEETRA